MRNKNVFITGAAGFIGSHLAKRLKERGDKVVGFDNFNAYYDPRLKHDRAVRLAKIEIPVIAGDIADRSTLETLIAEHEITHFVHLAAQAGVRYSLTHPDAYIQANITGFLHVLETCRKFPHLFLTYASSSSVYGLNDKIPFSVEDRTDRQASLYGVTKKSNELMADTYHHLFNIPVTGLRFFTVYGPWGRPDMAYFSFAKAIQEGRPIDLFNYGKMRRDFTYIDDIIDGVVAAIDLEAQQELFNLGNNHPEQLEVLVEALERGLGKKAHVRPLPMQPGDIEVTYADIEHSKRLLGFFPKTSLAEGVQRFLSWYLSYTETHSKFGFSTAPKPHD